MEVNHEDGRNETKAERPQVKKKSDKSDDGGQIDCIIGSYGKYQFTIFLFKIIIGVISAVHNLGVTFYAPTGFVGFWCADSQLASLSPGNLEPVSLEPNSSLAVAQRHFNESEPHKLPFADHLQSSTLARGESWSQVLRDFVHNEERGRRRSSETFDSDTPQNLRKECTYLSPKDNKLLRCTSFKYDTGIWMSTIIEEWDLVCHRSILVSITQSLYMTGSITAFVLFGYLSDRFGRWKSCATGYAIEILSGFGCAFSSNMTQFMLFRFLLGVGASGRSSTIYLIMIEWTGSKWRMHISTLGSLGWAVGYLLLPWLAMFFLHFRHLMLFACFYELLFAFWLILYIPESPRWLLTHHKFDEARRVLLTAAKFNGLLKPDGSESVGSGDSNRAIEMLPTSTAPASELEPAPGSRRRLSSISLTRGQAHQLLASLPNRGQQQQDEQQISAPEDDQDESNDSLQPYSLREFEQKFDRLVEAISQKEFTQNEDKLSYIDLIRWRNLRKYTLILGFAWACNSFIYYGIALRVGNFGGKNLFQSFTWAGFTELPSIVFTLFFMKFLPRKLTNLLLFSTVFLLCAIQAPLKYFEIGWLRQSSMILAKLFNSCSFIVILYQTMELFPTSIRQTAYSSCALSGRIGSILAPFVRELAQHTNNLVAPILYAVLSLIEILLIRYLPETRGTDLPDTLLEAEKFKGTNKKDWK